MKKKWFLMLLACLCLVFCMPMGSVQADYEEDEEYEEEYEGWQGPVYPDIPNHKNKYKTTSPWLKDKMDESIYENHVSAREDELNIVEKTPGIVEKYAAELLRNMGSSLVSLLQDKMGASLDRIVYGRVGSGFPNKVNIFAFELRKGNPYGVTASICYALLRGMMYVFLGICFIFQLVKAAWSGQTAKSREEIKSMFPTILAKFVAMALMPYLLDVALYVRDVVLYGIKEVTSDLISGGATLSLSESFLYNAERSGTFVDAVMYVGTVVLTIYFVFLYVSVAIDMLVCFVSFPFIVVMHSKKKDLIGSWIMTVFSNIMTPIIDAVLLLIPLLTSVMLYDVVDGIGMIELVMCMLIIPARSRFKTLLGIQGNDRNGFLGAMAMLSLGRAIAGKIKQGAGKIADAVSDTKNSKTHGELAEVDKEEEESLLSGDAGEKKDKDGRDDDVLSDGNGKGNDGEGMDDPADAPDAEAELEDTLTDEDTEGILPEGVDQDTAAAELDMAEDTGEAIQDAAEIGADAAVATTATAAAGSRTAAQSSQTASNSRGEALREIDGQVEASQSRVDELKEQRAGLSAQEKQISRRMLDHERGSENYRHLEKERADVQSRAANLDSQIAAETGKLNRLRAQSRQMHNALGMRNTPTAFDERRAEILRKRANISNFEQPQFKDVLTNDQMRVLYRRRAISNGVKAVAGTAGAVAFGTAAGSAALFMGPSAVAMATAGGISAGNSIGQASVDVATEIVRTAGPALKGVGTKAYHMADMAASAYVMNQIRPAAMQVEIASAPAAPQIYENDTGKEIAPDATEIGVMQTAVQETGVQETDYGMARIAEDASLALQRALSGNGSIRSGNVLRAMQQANVETERQVAILREEGGTQVTEDMVRETRVALQTEAVTGAILLQLENRSGYERGSKEYEAAEGYIREKVSALLEARDRPLV